MEGGKVKIIGKLSCSENHINISSYACNSKSLATSDDVNPIIISSKKRK